jgi:hypothetical protein
MGVAHKMLFEKEMLWDNIKIEIGKIYGGWGQEGRIRNPF